MQSHSLCSFLSLLLSIVRSDYLTLLPGNLRLHLVNCNVSALAFILIGITCLKVSVCLTFCSVFVLADPVFVGVVVFVFFRDPCQRIAMSRLPLLSWTRLMKALTLDGHEQSKERTDREDGPPGWRRLCQAQRTVKECLLLACDLNQGWTI